nr:hypothetical protein [uncultured Blautia sp.]
MKLLKNQLHVTKEENCSLRSQTDMVRTRLNNGIEKKVMLKADVICHIV